MTAKLLNFYDLARVAATRPRADDRICRPAGAGVPSIADARHIPRLRAPLECRWQIDPATGDLLACWVSPATGRGARGNDEDDIQPRPFQRQPLIDAGGHTATRAAA